MLVFIFIVKEPRERHTITGSLAGSIRVFSRFLTELLNPTLEG